ncbi:methyltransferase [Paramagnetospirillum marisnigri]|uniref:Methyltransferase n=1 Tax=Paramagnetospirillum marisnigri TaxID=1285242 RepID=A0A178MRF2_9PROT|nr:SAM-dependent methyltransferase [Paramagnetospirillum marisnigri]OAN50655.1 methyltransferase [Paramagnetospirillum marisnigri]
MSLSDLLAGRIRERGPIPVSEFMAEALGHPEFGYYMHRDPFGSGGDFTTAPEICQIFGELIGLWCAVVWQSMGMPSRVVLAEIGPGRGTLMADLLRAARTLPPFFAALEPWLVETSPALRNRQAQTLEREKVQWAERFEQLPEGPLLLVANELFDALPIRQLEKRGGRWFERMVGLDTAGGFTFTLGEAVEAPALAPSVLAAPDGSIAEINDAGRDLAAAMGRRLLGQGGAALIIDYGSATSGTADTLQAVKGHRYHSALADPGQVDLTAHVDFQALAEAAGSVGAKVHGPVSQGRWLLRLGIEERLSMLTQGANPAQAADLAGRARRLIDPAEMGTLFQVLALAGPFLPVPPGLEP